MIGIIGAMTKETEALRAGMTDVTERRISGIPFYTGTLCGRGVVVAVSGIGKVSAAVCTQTMILTFKPSAVICCGVAGGLSDTLCVGDIAVARAVVQHDVDTTALGDPAGLISGLDIVEIPCDGKIVEALANAAAFEEGVRCETGVIASGDQFICSDAGRTRIRTQFHAIAAEMEGGAIGQACFMNGVPFGVLRVISDGAGEDSHLSYAEFCLLAAARSVRIVEQFLKEFYTDENN